MAESRSARHASIINLEFPIASAFGISMAGAARGGNAGEGARATRPEGKGGNAYASRAWKGNGFRGRPVSLFPSTSAQQSAFSPWESPFGRLLIAELTVEC